jgi:hypothetical protein
VGKFLPINGNRVHTRSAGIMEYWNDGIMEEWKNGKEPRSEVRGRRSEIRGRRSEVGDQRSEIGMKPGRMEYWNNVK